MPCGQAADAGVAAEAAHWEGAAPASAEAGPAGAFATASYIRDMLAEMRGLALKENLHGLAQVLEKAFEEAASTVNRRG